MNMINLGTQLYREQRGQCLVLREHDASQYIKWTMKEVAGRKEVSCHWCSEVQWPQNTKLLSGAGRGST